LVRDREAERLRRGLAFNQRDQWKRLGKQPYVKLPEWHPDYDAEDLPHWWQRWFAEGVGAVVLILIVGTVAYYSPRLAPILPNFLDWLTARLT
jgi:hypothetical protein